MLRFILPFCLIYCQGFSAFAQNFSEKCAPRLRERAVETGKTVYTIVVDDLEAFKQKARAEGSFKIVKEYAPARILCIEAEPAVFFEKLLPDTGLLYADLAAPKPTVELPVPGHNLFVDKIALARARFPQYDGRGRTLSLKEDLFDTSDVDFKNRILRSANASARVKTHATIMATLIGGAGNSSPAGLGVATGCRFVGADFQFLLPDDDAVYAREQVSVQNHSYGAETDNFYGPDALAFDRSVQLRPTLLHVFSAGNRGETPLKTGPYANLTGFANLSGSFKMAKNVLLVGGVDSFGRFATYSSRGPTYDGRLKPELTAYGQDGTSGSAALTSGTALLLQQAYAEKNGGKLPGSDLLRAILIGSADDDGAPGPDYFGGFGRLNALRALELTAAGQYFEGTAKTGEVGAYVVELGTGNRQLDAALVWNDPPAAPGAAKALTNDLDLVVKDPQGNIRRPWVLHTAANADSLRHPARPGTDTLNNAERLRIDFPTPGRYTLEVRGKLPPGGSQNFALAWQTLKTHDFLWTAPLRNLPLEASSSNVLAWICDPALAEGRLEYKTTADTNWTLLDESADLRAGFFRWTAPNILAEAQFRMTAGGQIFLSDTVLVSKDLRLQVGFNCPDSLMLFWNQTEIDAAYRVSALGGRYFEPLKVQTDTFLILPKKNLRATRFSVAPLGPNGIVGKENPADYNFQGVNCYHRSFLANITPKKQAELQLSLGSNYALARVGFEKLENGRFVELGVQTIQSEQLEYVFTDKTPSEGANYYRARIETTAKGIAYSDTAQVWFVSGARLLVFPNPVAGNGVLSVLNGEEKDIELFLYNALGQLVEQQRREGYLIELTLPDLPAGIYPYVVKNGQSRAAGRLVVRQ